MSLGTPRNSSVSNTSLLAFSAAIAVSGASDAALINFTWTGSGSATFAGNAFNGNYTITAVGDTDNRQIFDSTTY